MRNVAWQASATQQQLAALQTQLRFQQCECDQLKQGMGALRAECQALARSNHRYAGELAAKSAAEMAQLQEELLALQRQVSAQQAPPPLKEQTQQQAGHQPPLSPLSATVDGSAAGAPHAGCAALPAVRL